VRVGRVCGVGWVFDKAGEGVGMWWVSWGAGWGDVVVCGEWLDGGMVLPR
jgi:hypothetical protein